MIKRMGDHISAADMAAFVDGSAGSHREDIAAHVAACVSCLAAYEDLLALRSNWMLESNAARVPNDVLRAGIEIPTRAKRERTAWKSHRARTASQSRARVLPLSRISAALIAAAVVLALAGAVWWPRGDRSSADMAAFRSAVTALLADQSDTGLLLTEPRPIGVAPVRDGNGHSISAETLAWMADVYNHESMSVENAYWLIAGYISVGHLRNAEAYMDEAIEMFPNNRRMLLLASVLAYRESDLATAERYLRNLLALYPRDAIANFNMAVVLIEQGRWDAAAPYVAMAPAAGSEVGRRAEALWSARPEN